MLAGIPIAASLGIGSPRTPMLAPFSLGLTGNAITVSRELYARIVAHGGENAVGEPAAAGAALKQVVANAAVNGDPPLPSVWCFRFSCHNYQLRYWMAAAGIDPERDIRLVVIPPPLMIESLLASAVQGFCVGEEQPRRRRRPCSHPAACGGAVAGQSRESYRHARALGGQASGNAFGTDPGS